jgi:protease-4
LIDINGEISAEGPVAADDVAKSMDEAYKNTHMKALVLRINSPGGSPVQADYIFQHIRYYEKKYPTIPVYAVCMDICASAAYYIAAASGEIYANPSSMVGSIGVLYNGFGFVDLMQKVGVQRRLFTAGKNKGFLDPFTPLDPAQVPYLQSMLDQVHQVFIARVEEGRGKRLVPNQDLYSGLIWSGTQAKSLGLIDGFYSSGQLIRDKIKVEQVVDYSYRRSMLDKFSKNLNSQSIDPRHLLSYSQQILR